MCSPASNALNKVKVPEWPEVPHTPAIVDSKLKSTTTMVTDHHSWYIQPRSTLADGGMIHEPKLHLASIRG